MMKSVKFLIVPIMMVLLSACSGGGGSNTTAGSNNTMQIESLSGVAQLGYIQNGIVKLYAIDDLINPIATTTTSSSANANDAGTFSFDMNTTLDKNKYYLLEVSGGKDIDPNDDGVLDAGEAIDLNGTMHALVKGEDLNSSFRVNALTDMAYQKLQANLALLNPIQLDTELDKIAKEYLYDVDADTNINYKDILKFDPTKHIEKCLKSYSDILNIYVAGIHRGDNNTANIASLMYIDKPEIIVQNGTMQTIPFQLKATLSNKPEGLSVKWYLNSVEQLSIDNNISKEGLYTVKAELYKDSQLVNIVSTPIIATQKTKIASLDVDINKENNISIVDSNSSLDGMQVIVPLGALEKNTTISIAKSSINELPNVSVESISNVLVMEPSGLQFQKPIQIRLPYDVDINITNRNIRIARYSADGTLDYINPTYIDTVKHEIVFETEHFTNFQGIAPKISNFWDHSDENFIDELNKEFSEYGYSMEQWKPILNASYDDHLKKVTLYDLLKTYFLNKKMVNIIDVKSGRYGADAIDALYPDSDELGRNFEMWSQFESAYSLLNTATTTVSSAQKILDGEMFSGILNSFGVPTEFSDFSLYDPVNVGKYIIKSFNKSENHSLMVQVLAHDNCKLENNAYDEYISDKLNFQGIKWVAESTCRRYKNFKQGVVNGKNTITQKEYIKLAIDKAIAYYEENQNAKINDLWVKRVFPANFNIDLLSKNDQVAQEQLKIYPNKKVAVELGYDIDGIDSLDISLLLRNKNGDVVESSASTISQYFPGSYSTDYYYYRQFLYFEPAQVSGMQEYTLQFFAKPKNGGNLQIGGTTFSFHIEDITEKPAVEITGISLVSGSLNSDGDFVGSFAPQFATSQEAPCNITFTYNGVTYNQSFIIKKEDFSDATLSNLQVTVSPTDISKENYSINNPSPFTFDIKKEINNVVTKQLVNQTLLQDDFSSLDTTKWIVTRVGYDWTSTAVDYDAVNINNGVLRLYNDQTDNDPILWSKPLKVSTGTQIKIKRRIFHHSSNSYHYPSMTIRALSNENDYFDALNMNDNIKCSLQQNIDNYSGHNGIYLGTSQEKQLDGIWDDWFNDELIYNVTTGEVKYTQNNTTVTGQCDPLNSDYFNIQIHSYGWFTGHYSDLDNIEISVGTF